MDDILLSICQWLLGASTRAIQGFWETSDPKFASEGVAFLGIREHPHGYHLSHEAYVKKLLARRQDVEGEAATPILPEKSEGEDVEQDLVLVDVRKSPSFGG